MDAEALDRLIIALSPAAQLGLAAALILIMFSVALGLRAADFAAVSKAPRSYAVGVATQVLGLPLLTLGLVALLAPPPSIALGMIVVAACPGGNVSNLLTHLARGDAALSVALTATSSVIAAFLAPALILLWVSLYPPTALLLESVQVDTGAFLLQMTSLLALPLLAGMGLRHINEDLAIRLQRPLTIVGTSILAVVIFAGLYEHVPVLIGAFDIILPPVILHNAAAFALGALAGFVAKAAPAQRRALTFEIGIQNAGLAVVILLDQLQGLGGAAAIATTWGVWHLIGGWAVVSLYRNFPLPPRS